MQYYITETSCERTDFFRVKKRGERILKFNNLTYTQQALLDIFIKQHASAENNQRIGHPRQIR
ncbi:MAG: hypothetical protein C4531_03175 [Desulfurivibrio sp.]|jgi:hypothetical protein|nr:MAG: hypothetical protein C4531_03175 [Desulfurivibrio sp.]